MKQFEVNLVLVVGLSILAIFQAKEHNYYWLAVDIILVGMNLIFWRIERKRYL